MIGCSPTNGFFDQTTSGLQESGEMSLELEGTGRMPLVGLEICVRDATTRTGKINAPDAMQAHYRLF